MSTIRETVDGLRGQGRGWTLLAVAAGWLFVNGFRVLLPAVLPQVKADFAVTNASAGFALTVLWLLYAGLQFPAGIAADRVGERTLLLGGAILGAVSFAAFYVAPVFVLFLGACALFGAGAGLFGTPRDMFLSRTYPETDSTAYGVTFAAGSIGAAALPYVATTIATRWGWRLAVVWLVPPLLAVAAALWWVGPPTAPTAGEDRLSARETVRRTTGALSNRSILLASGVFFPFVFTYQALLSFLPTYLVELKGLDQGFAALLFGLLFVVRAVVRPAVRRKRDHPAHRGPRRRPVRRTPDNPGPHCPLDSDGRGAAAAGGAVGAGSTGPADRPASGYRAAGECVRGAGTPSVGPGHGLGTVADAVFRSGCDRFDGHRRVRGRRTVRRGLSAVGRADGYHSAVLGGDSTGESHVTIWTRGEVTVY
ncbi:MAG: hypothetical protein BRD23_09095 [Halobacteriales archaeon SW_9_67_25]|nr:MAG: hypothetical protein BRD23_09095 [Halobacteriales archaeon SW_9_67_25]